MKVEDQRWLGYKVETPEATWVCTKSVLKEVGFTSPSTCSVDGIDFFLEFAAQNKCSAEIPDTRTLQLRTSEYLASNDPGFLARVVDGQMLKTSSWQQYIEVYKRD